MLNAIVISGLIGKLRKDNGRKKTGRKQQRTWSNDNLKCTGNYFYFSRECSHPSVTRSS